MTRRMLKNNEKSLGSKIADIFFICIAFIFVVCNCIFSAYVIKFDVLPMIYVVAMILILILFSIIAFVILINKNRPVALKIVISIIAILLNCVFIYGINYIKATITFMNSLTTEVAETEEYYIVTLNSSKYDSFNSLANCTIYTFMGDEDYTDITEEITSKIKVKFKDVDNIKKLADMLLNSEAESVLVSKSQYDMLSELQPEYKYKTQKIYTTIHELKKIEKNNELEDNKKEENTILSGAFNVYISGIDTSGRISNVARSDANILLTVNTKTNTILITSIPRDYYVTLYSKGIKDKLTHSGIYGIKETYSSVAQLLDIEIPYYVRVNFTSLEKIVDALGGIEVYSEYSFSTEYYKFNKGYNYLDGKMALEFSRERYSFADGDRQRIKNQQAVIQSIINKILTSETILTRYTSLLQSLSNSFQTNITPDEISHIIKGQLNDLSGWSIQMISLDGTGAYMPTYSYGSELLYVMEPDKTSVSNAVEKINEVLLAK